MKKKLGLIFFSVLLAHAGLTAQSVYMEMGFNTLSKIDYSNSGNLTFDSEQIFLPQSSMEVGLRHKCLNRTFFTLGLSSNSYSFMNNVYVPTPSLDESIHIQSLFELGYFGGNIGIDLLMIDYDDLTVFASGEFSGNLLTRGLRSDKVINAEASILSNENTNLMQDDHFKKLWCNIQLGITFVHNLSDLASIKAKYSYMNSLTQIDNDLESYNFNSHAFSVGLILHLGSDENNAKNNKE